MNKTIKNRKKTMINIYSSCVLFLLLFMASCKKETKLIEDPYAGGKKVLDISFITKDTDLDIMNAGEVVSLKIKGLSKYINDFKLYVNEIEAQVDKTKTNDNTVTFTVPLMASTGSVWITAQNQTFFGPIIRIGGKVAVDTQFGIVNGATSLFNGLTGVYQIFNTPAGRYWLIGGFTNFELKGTEKVPNGGIAQIDKSGAYTTADIDFGKGVFGGFRAINSISRFTSGPLNGKYIIAGNFTSYNSTRLNRQTLYNLARLNSNGRLDTAMVDVINPKPAEKFKNRDTISAFNAGTDGSIMKTFIYNDKVYLIGNFQHFVRMYLPNSSYDQKIYDRTKMKQLVRVNANDGTMDQTFHYNKATRKSPSAANGQITDAIMQKDGKLILVGSFTTFNDVQANRIVRLNIDGSVDNSFNVGTGANDDIVSIRYNEKTDKIMLSGYFSNLNGKAASGVAMLNPDGSNDPNFNTALLTGGAATFAGQLNNGKIIVAGSFNKYGNYLRQGFMILNPDGQLAVGYNNTGGFQGLVYDMIENTVAGGTRVILVGNIYRFNTIFPHNVLSIIISD